MYAKLSFKNINLGFFFQPFKLDLLKLSIAKFSIQFMLPILSLEIIKV